MKKRICLLIVISLLMMQFSVITFAQETEEAKTTRVYNEVLIGDITNVEDVLEVALEQKEMMEEQATSTYSSRSIDNDSSLQITQLVDATEDQNGNVEGMVAVTGLLVVDGNGRSVSANEIEKYHMGMTNQEGSLSNYSIRATHTIYVQIKYNSSAANGSDTLKLDHMKVRLYYDSSYTATMLRQRYADTADIADYDTRYQEQDWIYSPPAGSYFYYPSQARELPIYGFVCVQGSADIRYGTELMTVGTVLPTDFLQDKIDNGILAEGW